MHLPEEIIKKRLNQRRKKNKQKTHVQRSDIPETLHVPAEMAKNSSLAQKELSSSRDTKIAMKRKEPNNSTGTYFHSNNLQLSGEGTTCIAIESSDLLPIIGQQMGRLRGPDLRIVDVEEPMVNVNCVGYGQHAANMEIGDTACNGTSTSTSSAPPRQIGRQRLRIGDVLPVHVRLPVNDTSSVGLETGKSEGKANRADGTGISKHVKVLKQRMQSALSEVLTEADALEAERAMARLRLDFMLADALASKVSMKKPKSTSYSPNPSSSSESSVVRIAQNFHFASSFSSPADRRHLVDSGRIFPFNSGSACDDGGEVTVHVGRAAPSAVHNGNGMRNTTTNTFLRVLEEELEQVRTERREQRRRLFQESSKYQRVTVDNGQSDYNTETSGAKGMDVSGGSPQPRVYVRRTEEEVPAKKGKADMGSVLPKTIPTFESEAKMIPPPSPYSVLAYHPPQRSPPWGASQQAVDEATLSKRVYTGTPPQEDQLRVHVGARGTDAKWSWGGAGADPLLGSAKEEVVADEEVVCRADFWENVGNTISRTTSDGIVSKRERGETSVVERYCPHCKKDLFALAMMGSALSTTGDAGSSTAHWYGEKGRSRATSSHAPTRDTANLNLSALLRLHPSVCAYRKVQCKACGETVTARYAGDHERMQCSSHVFGFRDDHLRRQLGGERQDGNVHM